MPSYFIIKCRISTGADYLTSLIIIYLFTPKKFANDSLSFTFMDSCEKQPPFPSILSGAKVIIFRKFHKSFNEKIALSKIIRVTPNSQNSQRPHNELFL